MIVVLDVVQILLKLVAIVLLLFNGMGALYGGLSFMLHPDGSGLKMSVDYLRYSPFHDFCIPGLILFVCNGIMSFIAIALVAMAHRLASWSVILQGAILCMWIGVQVLMVRDFQALHAVMLVTGVLLLIAGALLRRWSQ